MLVFDLADVFALVRLPQSAGHFSDHEFVPSKFIDTSDNAAQSKSIAANAHTLS